MSCVSLSETLGLLGLQGQRFSLSQKKDGKLVSACFNDVSAAEAWITGTDGYVTLNPVREGCVRKPSDEDIAGSNWLLLDFDPKKDEEDPLGTSEQRRTAALAAADAAQSMLGTGLLIDSGRGAQVWLPVEPGVSRRRLVAFVRQSFKSNLVEVDATHDASRLARLPGTVNSRTGDEALVLDPTGTEPFTRAQATELLEGFEESVYVEIPDPDTGDPSQGEIRLYVRANPEAQRLWKDEEAELTGGDASKRDFRFLLALLKGRKISDDAASRLLYALPGGKAATKRSDLSYWVSTYRGAAERAQREHDLDERAATFLEKARSDPSSLWQPNTLLALARLRQSEKGRTIYQTHREELKRLSGSITELERAQKAALGDEVRRTAEAPDDMAVAVRQSDGERQRWLLRDARGAWTRVGETDVSRALRVAGRDPDLFMDLARQNPWKVTAAPFKPRLLPGRQWNAHTARFAVEPTEGTHPTWHQLLAHVGADLDEPLAENAWARRNRIDTGAAYLRLWLATMLQDPKSRRAYLFLHGPQGTGKSMFFEATKLLIGNGVVKANNALQAERFNGELQNAVLAYTEEVDLGAGGNRARVYNRLKDWSLGDTLTIEPKGLGVFEVDNVISWGQAANDVSYVPVFNGDDRITSVLVSPPERPEPKVDMTARLREEAPAFLFTLLNLKAPGQQGRYVVPPIMTRHKEEQSENNENLVALYCREHPDWIISTADPLAFTKIGDWIASTGAKRSWWSRPRILNGLPKTFEGVETGKAREALLEVLSDWTAPAAVGCRLGWTPQQAGSILRQLASGNLVDLEETKNRSGNTRRRYRLSR